MSCAEDATPISQVQGTGPVSPLLHQKLTVRGVVTLVQSGNGVYMEAMESTGVSDQSKAIFIRFQDAPVDTLQGSLVVVNGTVAELGEGDNTLTAIVDTELTGICKTGHALPLTDIMLPLEPGEREALEGMRVHIGGPLVITDVYGLQRGSFSLGGDGFQFVPTEIMAPGTETATLLRENRAWALAASLPEPMRGQDLLVVGNGVDPVSGVLSHDGRGFRLTLQTPVVAQPVNFNLPESVRPGDIRVVAMNLHNYFNGDGQGGGFPTSRGAKTPAGFGQQRNRIGAAIKVLDPHIITVMELENDGFGPVGAAADFSRLAESTTGFPWKVARPVDDRTGGDKITVGIFYRSNLLTAVGNARTLTGPEFRRSRQPLAQVFQPLPDGERILVVVNHLKSKGSCPKSGPNSDQHDGQGCWNPARTAAAEKMSGWVQNLATAVGVESVLIMGDMNAYRLEDPINTIKQAGFTELMDNKKTYSFVYAGLAGTLDFAFASPALSRNVQRVFIWHVNAALPAGTELPQPWLRFSDHDPVVVDLRSHQAVTLD